MTGPLEIGADLTEEQVAEFREAWEKARTGPQVYRIFSQSPVTPPPPAAFDYRVIITWPIDGPAAMITVHDADNGGQIYAVTRLAVYASADSVIWAHAEMLLGHDGKPSTPATGVLCGDDGEPVTGVFSVLVTETRTAPPRIDFQMPAGPST